MRLIDKISAKKLKELYWQRKMSSPEISKIYNRAPGYIRGLLRKYRIRVRTKSEAKRLLFKVVVPKKELREFYLKEKLSSPKISKKFGCSPGLIRNRLREYKIPIRSIQEALPLSNIPKYPRHNFSGDLEEKAYLIGFRLGDLHAYQARSRTILVFMSSSKRAQHKLFKNLFLKYGHIWQGWTKAPNGDRVITRCCYLNNTFAFLVAKKDLIEPWILRDKKYFAAFLAGYSDAEGSFCIYNRENGVFSFRSQDKNILHQIRAKLIGLGILCRPPQIARKKGTKDIRGIISNKDIWGLWVYRKDALLKLIDLLNPYLKHTDKIRRVIIVKNNVLERNKKYNRHQASKWDKLYINENINLCRAIPTRGL